MSPLHRDAHMVTPQDTRVRICSQVLKTTTDDVISDQCVADTCHLPLSACKAGSNRPETIYVPYFVALRPSGNGFASGENFTSATDYFTKNCLVPPPSAAAAATSASVADVSTSRLLQGKMALPEVQSIRVPIPKNLPQHLQHFDVLKGERRGRHMKRLGSPSDFIKVSQTIRASHSNLVLDSRG